MMDDPTPLPWKFVPWHVEEGPSAVRAPDGHLICSTASDANAAFIVKAVNSHDTLVKTLEEIVRIYTHETGRGRMSAANKRAIATLDSVKWLT